jgi:hypothetical protein
MHLNYWAIALATVLQFIAGAIWYMPIFGKLWGRIHGFDKVPKAEQDKMMKAMGPWLVLQLVVTFITTFVFALLRTGLPASWNVYGLAGFFWLGFVVPTQVSAVVFGGTEPRWMLKKSSLWLVAHLFV